MGNRIAFFGFTESSKPETFSTFFIRIEGFHFVDAARADGGRPFDGSGFIR